MAFIISKKSKRHGQLRQLYYLVESYRQDHKVKRKTLLSLKEYTSVEELLKHAEQKKALTLDRMLRTKKAIDDYRQHGTMPPFFIASPYISVESRLGKNFEKRILDLEQCNQDISRIKSFL